MAMGIVEVRLDMEDVYKVFCRLLPEARSIFMLVGKAILIIILVAVIQPVGSFQVATVQITAAAVVVHQISV